MNKITRSIRIHFDLLALIIGQNLNHTWLTCTLAGMPAIFGSIFEGVARRMASKEWSEWVERHKNLLKTLGLGV
jgi:hypothetical protein